MAEDGATPTDEDSLARAMRLQATRNLDFSQGISTTKSFLSFPDVCISSNMKALGVSFGSTGSEVNISVNALRRVEFDRSKVSPKVNDYPTDDELDDEEDNATYDGKLLSHLVGMVSEVRLDDVRLGSICDLTTTTRKSKSHRIVKSKPPSKRARANKSPYVSL